MVTNVQKGNGQGTGNEGQKIEKTFVQTDNDYVPHSEVYDELTSLYLNLKHKNKTFQVNKKLQLSGVRMGAVSGKPVKEEQKKKHCTWKSDKLELNLRSAVHWLFGLECIPNFPPLCQTGVQDVHTRRQQNCS